MAEPIPKNLPAEQMVIALINRDNGLNLSASDVVVERARVNPTPTEIENTGFYRDTLATLRAIYGGDFKESVDVTYRRLDAGVIFGKTVAVIRPNKQTTNADFIADLNRLYGLALETNDFVIEPVDISKIPTSIGLTFKTDNPAWKGTIEVLVRKLPINLGDVLTTTTMPVLQYPTRQAVKIQGDLYCYAGDFTPSAAVLVKLTVNTPVNPLLPILNAFSEMDSWVIRAQETDFNLYDASVVYNGPVAGVYSTRTGFDRVLVVQLDSKCANVAGRLIFHYNLSGG